MTEGGGGGQAELSPHYCDVYNLYYCKCDCMGLNISFNISLTRMGNSASIVSGMRH